MTPERWETPAGALPAMNSEEPMELAAGVVHQTADAAMVGEHPLDGGDDGVFIANVGDMGGNRTAVVCDLTPIPLPPPVMTTMWSRNRSRR